MKRWRPFYPFDTPGWANGGRTRWHRFESCAGPAPIPVTFGEHVAAGLEPCGVCCPDPTRRPFRPYWCVKGTEACVVDARNLGEATIIAAARFAGCPPATARKLGDEMLREEGLTFGRISGPYTVDLLHSWAADVTARRATPADLARWEDVLAQVEAGARALERDVDVPDLRPGEGQMALA